MGAPFRHWVFRVLVALAAAGGVAVVSLHVSFWLCLVVLASCGVAGLEVMFRHVPAFDPLGRIRWRLPGRRYDPKRCAITFDDGPSPATAAVLDILAKEGVPATFFVLGGNVARYPAMVQRAHAECHAVGIHGMTHVKLAGAAESAIEQQVRGASCELERLGVALAPVYRTPHGLKSQGVFEVARRHGLTLWAWTRGVWDTDRPDPAVLVRRATRLARSGMVLLLHDGHGDDPQPDVTPMLVALPDILRELKRRGFTFVRLADV
jgi:peptidoglycan/xylan/chitin deacetylase (PgdA/CDA1 family)